jgi:hypothetical protein
MLSIGWLSILLLIANTWMCYVAFGPFLHYLPFYRTNLFLHILLTYFFYFIMAIIGFTKLRFFLFIIIFSTPSFVTGAIQSLEVDLTSRFNLFAAGHSVSILLLILSLLSYLALFFWWKESRPDNPKTYHC